MQINKMLEIRQEVSKNKNFSCNFDADFGSESTQNLKMSKKVIIWTKINQIIEKFYAII